MMFGVWRSYAILAMLRRTNRFVVHFYQSTEYEPPMGSHIPGQWR